MSERYGGIYRAIVVDNKDWENHPDRKRLGRVQVHCPAIYGPTADKKNLPWATPKVLFAGPNYGLIRIPKVNEKVWIQFENGDPQLPVYEGSWFGLGDLPDELFTGIGYTKAGENEHESFILKTPSGYGIKISDTGIELFYHPQNVKTQGGENTLYGKLFSEKLTNRENYRSIVFTASKDFSVNSDSKGALVLDIADSDIYIKDRVVTDDNGNIINKLASSIVAKLLQLLLRSKTIQAIATNEHLKLNQDEETEGDMSVISRKNFTLMSKNGSTPLGGWHVR